jgi:hypothetical protein
LKTQVNPIVVGVVIALVLLCAGFFMWKSGQGVNGGSGKLQSNLGPVETNPDKFKQGIADSLKRDQQKHGQ